MTELTQREWHVLTYIAGYIRRHNQSPSMREIAAHLGRKMGWCVADALNSLEAKGVIRRPQARKRYRRERAISLVRGVRVGVRP